MATGLFVNHLELRNDFRTLADASGLYAGGHPIRHLEFLRFLNDHRLARRVKLLDMLR